MKEHAPGYQLFHPKYAFLFNSYSNSPGSGVNRAFRKGECLTDRRLTDKHVNLIVQRYLGPKYVAISLRW